MEIHVVAPFVHRIRVRYNECDAQGAVFNANYLVYFDVTITELWREAFGSYDVALQRYGLDLVVAEANVRYLAPARFDDELDVALTLERIGNTAITERYEVTRAGTAVAEGRVRHVFVDLTEGRKREIPDEVRGTLERYT
jgi:acyl-CoA thioester hydrolase